MNKWLALEKPEAKSRRKRGDVHVTLLLSTEKDQNLTSQEHKHLLKILFAHELQRTDVNNSERKSRFNFYYFHSSVLGTAFHLEWNI